MRGDREKMDTNLPMISRVTANLKTWIDGTFHGVREKHLQAYLNAFMFRFNRRFYSNFARIGNTPSWPKRQRGLRSYAAEKFGEMLVLYCNPIRRKLSMLWYHAFELLGLVYSLAVLAVQDSLTASKFTDSKCSDRSLCGFQYL
jgi:hypothetical protein